MRSGRFWLDSGGFSSFLAGFQWFRVVSGFIINDLWAMSVFVLQLASPSALLILSDAGSSVSRIQQAHLL